MKYFYLLILFFMILFKFLPANTFAKDEDEFNLKSVWQKLTEKKQWIQIGEPLFLTGSDLKEAGDDMAENLLEFKIEAGWQGTYQSREDSIGVGLSIYRAPSQILAFGFYAAEKSPSEKFVDIGYEAYQSGATLLSWYGTYVIVTTTSDTLEKSTDYVRQLARNIIEYLPELKKHTPILDSLPEKDRVKNSKKFYVRRWLAQDYFRNIYYADYYTREGYSRIFIIDNRSTATADSNFWRYYSFIKNNGSIIFDELKVHTDYYIVEEPLWGKTILAKKNQIIYGILDYRNKEWTEERLEEILNNLKKKKIVKLG